MNKLRLFILLSLLFFSSGLCFGQKEKSKRTIIKYSDGTVYFGQVIKEDASSIKMISELQDTITLQKMFVREIRQTSKHISLYNNEKHHYTQGLFFSLQFGFGLISIEEAIQMNAILGYRINKRVAAGIGIGASYHATPTFGPWLFTNALPVFLYGRYYPTDKKVKFFFAGKFGWAFPQQGTSNNPHHGGILIQPEIGINFSAKGHSRFLITLGQQIQNIRVSSIDFNTFGNQLNSDRNIWYNQPVLKIAIEWK